MNYSRVLVFKRRVNFSEDFIVLLDTKFNKTVEIPFDKSRTPEQNVYDWLDARSIPYIGIIRDHVICEFEGPIPTPVEFNIPETHVIEVSTLKNEHGNYVIRLYSSRYTQYVYTEIKELCNTIDTAYLWLENHGFYIVSSDVESLKMYVITSTFKPLYTTPELV